MPNMNASRARDKAGVGSLNGKTPESFLIVMWFLLWVSTTMRAMKVRQARTESAYFPEVEFSGSFSASFLF